MPYELVFTDTFKKDFKKLDRSIKLEFKAQLKKLKQSQLRFRRLRHHSSLFRMRVRNFRIVYQVKDKTVFLLFFKKRRHSYRNA